MKERKRRFWSALLTLLMLCTLTQPAFAGTITNNGAFQFGVGSSMENGGSFVNGANGVVRGSGYITINPGGSFVNQNNSLATAADIMPSIINRAGASGVTGSTDGLNYTTYYTVTLDPNGGTFGEGTKSSLFVESGESPITELNGHQGTTQSIYTPTRNGFKFKGWFTSATVQNETTQPNNAISSDMKLYAGWEAIPTATLTLTASGFTPTVKQYGATVTANNNAYTVYAGEPFTVTLALASGWWLPEDTGDFYADDETASFVKSGNTFLWNNEDGISEPAVISVTDVAYRVANGTAMTLANALGQSDKVCFNGTETLETGVTIGEDKELYIANGATLTIPADKTLTNAGTLINEGQINNSGTIDNEGEFTNNATVNGGTFNHFGYRESIRLPQGSPEPDASLQNDAAVDGAELTGSESSHITSTIKCCAL